MGKKKSEHRGLKLIETQKAMQLLTAQAQGVRIHPSMLGNVCCCHCGTSRGTLRKVREASKDVKAEYSCLPCLVSMQRAVAHAKV